MALIVFALGGLVGFVAALVAVFALGFGILAGLAVWSLSGLAFGALALLPSRRVVPGVVPV